MGRRTMSAQEVHFPTEEEGEGSLRAVGVLLWLCDPPAAPLAAAQAAMQLQWLLLAPLPCPQAWRASTLISSTISAVVETLASVRRRRGPSHQLFSATLAAFFGST